MEADEKWRKSVVAMFSKGSVTEVIGMGCGDGFVVSATNGEAGIVMRGEATRETKNQFVALTSDHVPHRVTKEDRLRWALPSSNGIRVRGK